MLLEQLGTVSSATKESRGLAREKRRTFNRIVSEIYSPPRVTAEIQRSGFKHLRAGLVLDLTVSDPDDGQPWDLSRKGQAAHTSLTADTTDRLTHVHRILHLAASERRLVGRRVS